MAILSSKRPMLTIMSCHFSRAIGRFISFPWDSHALLQSSRSGHAQHPCDQGIADICSYSGCPQERVSEKIAELQEQRITINVVSKTSSARAAAVFDIVALVVGA